MKRRRFKEKERINPYNIEMHGAFKQEFMWPSSTNQLAENVHGNYT